MRKKHVPSGPILTILRVLGLMLAVVTFPSQIALPQQAEAVQETSLPPLPPLPPLPLSPTEKAEKDGTALRLSLKDITKLALQNNLDIAISDTNEAYYQQGIVQAHGPYDPSITLTLYDQSTKSPNTNLATKSSLGSFSKTDTAVWNLLFQQNIKTGGYFSASYNSNRYDSTQSFFLFSPQYQAATTVSFTQPLRRNFRIDQIRGTIKLANLDVKTNDSQFRQKVLETIASIQGQYWDLVGAIRNYDIKRDAVRLAQITLRDNRRKLEIGTLASIQVTEAQAAEAQRELDLISAEEMVYNAENALLSLVSNDRNAEIWHKVIIPTETPEFVEYKVDLDAAIDTAFKKRPELEQLDIAVQRFGINQRMSEDMRKWQIDLLGTFGTSGVAGPQSYITDPITGQQAILIDPNLVGGIGNAYKLLFTGGYTNWSVGFKVVIPLRNRTVDAQLAQIKIGTRQQLMKRKSMEQQIQTEIRNAVQKIETNRKQVETAKVSLEFNKEQLMGEQKRFEAGLSQNFQVLDKQSQLSQAQFAELQALIAYKKSVIALQKGMWTLLESNDFEIAKTTSDNVPNLK